MTAFPGSNIDPETFSQQIYRDEPVRKLIAEEALARAKLIDSVREDFDNYYENMGVGHAVYHRQIGAASVRHSAVVRRNLYNFHEFDHLWTEEMHVETDPETLEPILHIRQDGMAVARHGRAFRISTLMRRIHSSGLEVRTEKVLPKTPGGSLWKRSNQRNLRDFAYAPEYLEDIDLLDLLDVRGEFNRPRGILISLGPDTVVESPTTEFEDRKALLPVF